MKTIPISIFQAMKPSHHLLLPPIRPGNEDDSDFPDPINGKIQGLPTPLQWQIDYVAVVLQGQSLISSLDGLCSLPADSKFEVHLLPIILSRSPARPPSRPKIDNEKNQEESPRISGSHRGKEKQID
ncbi:unnamed protein product [Linum trigynum]|uniref:Uncharacterized protein n=1 Tax=Linum trigynum TaxID=586398 RepID=A0AAV2EW42_9ROSI